MKKLFAVLLVLVMALSAAAYAEEEEWVDFPVRHPDARAFDSCWVSGDAMVRIDAFCRLDGFEMNIVEITGDETFNAWEYIMDYDEETRRLVCNGIGLKSVNTVEDDEIADSYNVYEDGTASFYLGDDGNLYWDDEKESTFQATAFHKIGKFPDVYVSDKATIAVKYAGEDLIYDVDMEMDESENQDWSWSLAGSYDPASDTLPVQGFKLLYTYRDDGELDLDAEQFETEVNAVFTVNEDRTLVCSSDDPAIDGMVFERTWTQLWQWVF